MGYVANCHPRLQQYKESLCNKFGCFGYATVRWVTNIEDGEHVEFAEFFTDIYDEEDSPINELISKIGTYVEEILKYLGKEEELCSIIFRVSPELVAHDTGYQGYARLVVI